MRHACMAVGRAFHPPSQYKMDKGVQPAAYETACLPQMRYGQPTKGTPVQHTLTGKRLDTPHCKPYLAPRSARRCGTRAVRRTTATMTDPPRMADDKPPEHACSQQVGSSRPLVAPCSNADTHKHIGWHRKREGKRKP